MILEIDCLGTTPLSREAVREIFVLRDRIQNPRTLSYGVQQLCLSHERLRAEVEGAETLLAERARGHEYSPD